MNVVKQSRELLFCRSCCSLTKECKIILRSFAFLSVRKNAFQVIAVDGVCSGVIQFPTAEDCLDWLQAISSNISSLTKHNVSIKQQHLLALQPLAVPYVNQQDIRLDVNATGSLLRVPLQMSWH